MPTSKCDKGSGSSHLGPGTGFVTPGPRCGEERHEPWLARQALDRAVGAAYRKLAFETERHRVEYLFGQYQQITAPLIGAMEKQTRKRR